MRLIIIICGLVLLYISGFLQIDEPERLSQSVPCYVLNVNLSGLTEVDCQTSTRHYDFANPDLSVFYFQGIPVNQASSELLQTVSGVGPSLAGAIVEYRRIHGQFTGLDSIKKLPGVGDKRARYLMTQLTFD